MKRFETNNASMLSIGCASLVVIAVAWFGGAAFALMLAWNLVSPTVFGLPEITYWQAFGGVVLLSLVGAVLKSNVSVSR